MDDRLEVPQATGWDHVHAIAKGAFGSLPLAGGLAAEFFNLIVKPPLLKKHERWMDSVVGALSDLAERNPSFNPQTLVENESFSVVLLCAAEAALRTSDEGKLKALRNAVLNTAVSPNKDAHIRETLIFLINRLTSDHIRVLVAFASYLKRRVNLPPAPEFPVLSGNIGLTNALTLELIDLNLVTMPRTLRYSSSAQPFWKNETGGLGSNSLTLTDLGAKLIEHLSEPTMVQSEGG